ncbi:MAG: repressor LexA [Candidatus Fischerbacteria bacterium RBG_13_37_8]|uniref:LexA repressor n=1 Tax=Candidatus Fischerbacteria bacterium RBG_13_37_8 TaxID=1817863 RepID=A0A1F5VW40_9BACT|nr:MAG: repressor LexA [Candidatus Fischerbacteria bacterium RBG_13_37_8]
MTLTPKQHAMLCFIQDFTARHGYAPSYREIADHFHLRSVATVHKHMKSLAAKEKIKKKHNLKRTVEFLESPPHENIVVLPLLGFIAAGKPIEAIQIEETFKLPENMMNGKEGYVLKVRGDSMIEEHIQDGDYVIVEKRNYAHSGEMVVALINDNDVTLKRIYFEGDKIRLQPANPAIAPLLIAADEIKIQGIVIGLMRKYR